MIRSLLPLLEGSRADAALRALFRRGVVLAYHGILAAPKPHRSGLHVDLATFEAHLGLLTERGYRFLSLSEFLERLRAGKVLSGCAAVTFDDAYASTLRALPSLRSAGIPGTLFIPTGAIGTSVRYWWDALDLFLVEGSSGDNTERAHRLGVDLNLATEAYEQIRGAALSGPEGFPDPVLVAGLIDGAGIALDSDDYRAMTWTEISTWTAWEGGSVAPHTVTHPVLPRLARDHQAAEMRSSFETLQERISTALPIMAYPYGLYNRDTLLALEDAGLRNGLTMDRIGVRTGYPDARRVARMPADMRTRMARLGLLLSAPAEWHRKRRDFRNGFPCLPHRRLHPEPRSTG